MSNQEPSQELLRWGDVKAWQPRLSFYLVRKWCAAGLLEKKRIQPGGWPYYRKSELKKLLGLV